MARLTAFTLFVVVQVVAARRTKVALDQEMDELEAEGSAAKCPCAICKQPNAIRTQGWDDKSFCHWSRGHGYFWCRVQSGCSCARSWTKCGAGTAHFEQLLEKVQSAAVDADPCMFEEFTDPGRDFLAEVRYDKKYPNQYAGDMFDNAIYVQALEDLDPLVAACGKHEPFSRVKQGLMREESLLRQVREFLQSHSNRTKDQPGPRSFMAEISWGILSQRYYSHGSLYNDQEHCQRFANSPSSYPGELGEKVQALCSQRREILDTLTNLLSAERPRIGVFKKMQAALSHDEKENIQKSTSDVILDIENTLRYIEELKDKLTNA